MIQLESTEGTGSSVEHAVAAARADSAAFIRARIRSPTRACPRGIASENPGSVRAGAATTGLPARGVRVRPRGGERS